MCDMVSSRHNKRTFGLPIIAKYHHLQWCTHGVNSTYIRLHTLQKRNAQSKWLGAIFNSWSIISTTIALIVKTLCCKGCIWKLSQSTYIDFLMFSQSSWCPICGWMDILIPIMLSWHLELLCSQSVALKALPYQFFDWAPTI